MIKDIIRIRKYPNRRLYDTSRSAFITASDLHETVRSGRQVEVVESASGVDITNIVLLNSIIERDPTRILAIPTAVLHAMITGDEAMIKACCAARETASATNNC